MAEKWKRYRILDSIWDREISKLIKFLDEAPNPTQSQRKIRKKLKKIPDEVKDMTLYLYYEKCKSKHSIEFFSWFEAFRPKAKELVTKYVDRLKEQLTKENNNIDENITEEEEAEGDLEEEKLEDLDNSPSKMLKEMRTISKPKV